MKQIRKNCPRFKGDERSEALAERSGGGLARLLDTSLLLLLILLFSACHEDDDYRYPSVVTDYACLVTGTHGQPMQLLLDNGRDYPVTLTEDYREGQASHTTFEPDTTYRVVSIYELGADSTAQLYSVSKILSEVPTPLRQGERMNQDPVYLRSYWLSGGYLNLVMEVKALNGRHRVGLVDTTPRGMHGKEVTFYHEADDIESYRQKLYVSVPLAPFGEALQQGDTLRFVVNLYDTGVTRLEMVM